jgi:tetratricopeptide (TPR) repeat protein
MNSSLKACLSLALIAVYSNSPSISQTASSWQKLTQQGQEAAAKGDYKTAEMAYSNALDEARTAGKKDAELAMSLNNLGNLYCSEKKFDDAKPIFEEALGIVKALFGANHTNVAAELNNLANCYVGQNNLKESESSYRAALAINQKSTDPRKSILASLVGLANVLLMEHKAKEAKPIAQEALAYLEKHPQQPISDLANTYSLCANVYLSTGDLSLAEPLLVKATGLDEKAFGKNSQQLAVDTSNLATLRQRQGKSTEASKLYEQSLGIKGTDSSDTNKIATLANLANMAMDKHQNDQAVDYFKQAIDLCQKDPGKNNDELMQLQNGLGCLYVEQNNLDEAEKLLFAAIATAQDMANPPLDFIATSCNNVGNALYKQNKFDEAEMMLKRCVDTREKLNGPNNRETGLAVSNLAVVYASDKKYDESEALFKQAISIFESAPNSKNDLKNCYQNYAGMVQASGNQERATQLAAKGNMI